MHGKTISQRKLKRLARKAAVTCGGVALAVHTGAVALGLGAPEVQSYLAQPLKLRIPLRLDSNDIGADDYRARVLPADAYPELNLLGNEYQTSDFRISLSGNKQQGYWLYITSNRSIREPILSLVFEVRNPSVRLVQSIDVLLDPVIATQPSLSASQATPVKAGLLVAAKTEATQAQTSNVDVVHASLPIMSYISGPEPVAHLLKQAKPPHIDGITHYYGPIRPGESLSRIAQRARLDPKTPLADMMQAIYAANRSQFQGDQNALKVGGVLAIPLMVAAPPGGQSSDVPLDVNQSSTAPKRIEPSTMQANANGPEDSAPPLDTEATRAQSQRTDSTRVYMQGQRLALDLHMQSATQSAAPSSIPESKSILASSLTSPIALTANPPAIDLTTDNTIGDEAPVAEEAVLMTRPQGERPGVSLNWSWLVAFCLVSLIAAFRYRHLWKTALLRAERQTKPDSNAEPGLKRSTSRLTENAPGSLRNASNEQLDKRSQLHLKLTTTLADDPSDETRSLAKLALSHLENNELEKAEAVVESLQITLKFDDDLKTHPKIIKLKQH